MDARDLKTRTAGAREQVARLRAAMGRAVRLREQNRYLEATQSGYEVIEKALKAALLYVGIQPPPWVNVGPQLEENRARFSPSFQENLDIAVYAARVSWEWREADFDVKGTEDSSDDPYDDYDAESALETAERVLAMVEELIQSS